MIVPTKVSCFPQALHAMITELASVAPNVVSWIEGGEAFVIHDPKHVKLGEFLDKYFNRKYDILDMSEIVQCNVLTHIISLVLHGRFQVQLSPTSAQQLWISQTSWRKVSK
jgi:hypothetical protein